MVRSNNLPIIRGPFWQARVTCSLVAETVWSFEDDRPLGRWTVNPNYLIIRVNSRTWPCSKLVLTWCWYPRALVFKHLIGQNRGMWQFLAFLLVEPCMQSCWLTKSVETGEAGPFVGPGTNGWVWEDMQLLWRWCKQYYWKLLPTNNYNWGKWEHKCSGPALSQHK